MISKRGYMAVVAVLLCASLVGAGCGGSSKRRASYHRRYPRGGLTVRGQSHKEPPVSHEDLFIWPLKDFTFMSGFGIRRGRRHDGIDLAAKSGTPIKAAADGKVVFSGRMRGYGNLILLKHDQGYFTAYAHNRRNLVSKGKDVKQGEVVAQVGRTGRATGNHVHFEIRQGQEAMDPLNFLPARAGVIVKKSTTKKATVAASSKTSATRSPPTKQTVVKKTPLKTTVAKKSKISSKKPAAAPSHEQEDEILLKELVMTESGEVVVQR